MRLRRPLDDILTSSNKVKILRVLISPGLELTGREIAAEARINHAGCARALNHLATIGVLRRRKTGRAHLYSVRRENRVVERGLSQLFRAERDVFPTAVKYLQARCGQIAVTAVLFGSYARSEERIESDLDVFFGVKAARDVAELAATVDRFHADFAARFGVHLNPYIKTIGETRIMASKRQPPVSQILREGKDLFGQPLKGLVTHEDATRRA